MKLRDLALTGAARLLDPEIAHRGAIAFLKYAPSPSSSRQQANLTQTICGLNFSNPIGLAAGFDKNAEVPGVLMKCGFGFVEVGTITPKPQSGNAKPRLFRLPQQHGLINRFGFNNDGIEVVSSRLTENSPGGPLGINIGANKDSEDRIADYVKGVQAFQHFASYFTVNISSPNTPGLRALQTRDAFLSLTEAALEARASKAAEIGKSPPVFVKIAPDLDEVELDTIATVALSSGIDGLIISNTTLARPVPLGTLHRDEQGGFSGAPLFERSTIILAKMRQRVGTKLTLIGVGGIDSAERALQKIEAGANLVQLYTGMVYGGFGLPEQICKDLSGLVAARCIDNIGQLTSTKTDEWAAKPITE